MALKLVTGVAVALAITVGAGACATLVGTSDLEACEGDCAGSGGSGGSGSTGTESSTGGETSSGSNGSSGSSSSGSGDTSSSSGGSCFPVTLTYEGVTGEGRVRIAFSPDGVEFDEGESQHCLPPGEKTISLECRTELDDTEDYPLVVDWGNDDSCPDVDSSCTFTLVGEETFTLTGACD